ncbi:MAG TPA: GNAT family N-acetyltransferase [Burkholderiales bacterium]|nr:GNAT family N-acetyltransferase [Burkholderiales bacterium]
MSGGWSSPSAALAAPPPAARVEALRGPDELAALVPEWEALAGAALEPSPFYEHWMLRPALQWLAAEAPVRIVAVRVDGALAGVFPFQELRRYKGLPLRGLRLWRHRHCMLCVPLVRRDAAAACLDALLDWASHRAALLEMECIPAGGAFHCALLDAGARRGSAPVAEDVFTRAVLRKAQSAERYLESALSSTTRRKLARKARRLAERGALAHVRLEPETDIGRWTEEFLALEASGWKGERGSALASREGDGRFAAAVFEEAFRRGRLFSVGVSLDGAPIARCCTLLAAPGSFAFKTAYDERFADFSPGVLAELDRIAAFHGLEGIEWMDSFTGTQNKRLDAMWKDRIAVQTLALALNRRGALALAALPALRFAKRALRPG